MRTNNPQNPNSNPSFFDPTAEVLKEQWLNAVRRVETREADFDKAKEADRAQVQRQNEKISQLIEQREVEYNEDRERIRKALLVCTQDLDAAHRAASVTCGDILIRYIPNVTSESDVLRVPLLTESEVARSLDLKNGGRISGDKYAWSKVACTALCAIVTSIAWGMLLFNVNYRHPLKSPSGLVFSLVAGIAVALLVRMAIGRTWTIVGTREGSGQSAPLIAKARNTAVALTTAILVALVTLDGLGICRANAARAEFNPASAIPLWLAIIAACAINVSYVIGFAYASHAEAYNAEAGSQISSMIRADERSKQEGRRDDVRIHAALNALGQVQIVKDRIAEYETQLKKTEREFSEALIELTEAYRSEPAERTPEEAEEIERLKALVKVAKDRYDAHVSSRGVNYSVSDHTSTSEVE